LPYGGKEQWSDTVARVCAGNLALVYGERETWDEDVKAEYDELYEAMYSFKILPAGRHLWATGVKGRQYLQNCFVSGWPDKLSEHFSFAFMRLMEGGGVGANYSEYLTGKYGAPKRQLTMHVVCDREHKDFGAVDTSSQYVDDWAGAYQVEDSREGWANALSDLIDTFYAQDVKHSNRVYDVSLVRPEGAKLRTYGGAASGPAPFARLLYEVTEILNAAAFLNELTPLHLMEIDHAVAQAVVAGGVRRSARMSIVRWDDPFVFRFIDCKADTGKHWTTNISVEINDEFFAALDSGRAIPGPESHAERLLAKVSTGMLRNGEPGFWNSQASNVGELSTVYATNPCGEIALNDFEPCTLGHVNLDAFAPNLLDSEVDSYGLFMAHRLMTRFLMRATYGDKCDAKQATIMARNRRIGVGHFGVQGFLNKQGIRYSEAPKNIDTRALLQELHHMVMESARDYAFELRIPEPVKTTTVAPTGSIAKLPGVSEGCHPIYAKFFNRRIRFSMIRPEEIEQVEAFAAQGYLIEDDIYDKSGNTKVVVFPSKDKLVAECELLGYDDIVESADELSLEQLLDFQEMYQSCYADNAVSFTANIAENRYSTLQIADILRYYLPRLKGTTIFPELSRPQSPYTRITKAEYELAEYLANIDSSNDEECVKGCPVR